MFREIILPIFRSTRLCVTACGVMHPPRCCRPSARGCKVIASVCVCVLCFIRSVLDNDQLDTHLLHFTIRLIIILYIFRALYAHHHEVELYWCSIWYRHSQSVAVRCTWWERTSSLPTCALDGHWLRVTIPNAVSIQFKLLMMSI